MKTSYTQPVPCLPASLPACSTNSSLYLSPPHFSAATDCLSFHFSAWACLPFLPVPLSVSPHSSSCLPSSLKRSVPLVQKKLTYIGASVKYTHDAQLPSHPSSLIFRTTLEETRGEEGQWITALVCCSWSTTTTINLRNRRNLAF